MIHWSLRAHAEGKFWEPVYEKLPSNFMRWGYLTLKICSGLDKNCDLHPYSVLDLEKSSDFGFAHRGWGPPMGVCDLQKIDKNHPWY